MDDPRPSPLRRLRLRDFQLLAYDLLSLGRVALPPSPEIRLSKDPRPR